MQRLTTTDDKLDLARQQLAKVQVAAWDPVDWLDVSLYGFYALENAVAAAADHAGIHWKQTHPSKVDASVELTQGHGLPDIAELLRDLNAIRKSSAYGEYLAPHGRSAEEIASEVEGYIDAVASFVDENDAQDLSDEDDQDADNE